MEHSTYLPGFSEVLPQTYFQWAPVREETSGYGRTGDSNSPAIPHVMMGRSPTVEKDLRSRQGHEIFDVFLGHAVFEGGVCIDDPPRTVRQYRKGGIGLSLYSCNRGRVPSGALWKRRKCLAKLRPSSLRFGL